MLGPSEATSSSLQALTDYYTVITNNLANANTAGYKRRLSLFAETLANEIAAGDSIDAAAAGGTIIGQPSVDFTQGTINRTDRPLDCAISGKGFFVLETAQGRRYTRNGVFNVNLNRQLVDLAGRLVAGTNGPIAIPGDVSPAEVRVNPDGTVSARGNQVGTLEIAVFEDDSVLLPVGANTYEAPADIRPGSATADTRVVQGYQESSNVSIVNEMVNLISVARLYESNFKAIKTADEQMSNLLNVAAQS
ncbi:MAG: flagellar hook-basal body protein [Planctomycetota bacterium]|jgi:flagellar basal body rod protein FlgG